MELPDLASYTLSKTIDDIDLEGAPVPGLRADFLRRQTPAGLATVGVYRLHGAELFMAWGYVGEPHCRWTAYRRDDSSTGGGWSVPHDGCPRVRRIGRRLLLDTGTAVIELPTVDAVGTGPLIPTQAPPVIRDEAERPAADLGCPSRR